MCPVLESFWLYLPSNNLVVTMIDFEILICPWVLDTFTGMTSLIYKFLEIQKFYSLLAYTPWIIWSRVAGHVRVTQYVLFPPFIPGNILSVLLIFLIFCLTHIFRINCTVYMQRVAKQGCIFYIHLFPSIWAQWSG